MTRVNWSNNVNTKFYGYSAKPKDNVVLTENLSGRTVGHKANSKDVMQIKCSLLLTAEELSSFWSWFNNTLGQMAGAFYCADLGGSSTQLYRFLSVPELEGTDQVWKSINLEIEEVF